MDDRGDDPNKKKEGNENPAILTEYAREIALDVLSEYNNHLKAAHKQLLKKSYQLFIDEYIRTVKINIKTFTPKPGEIGAVIYSSDPTATPASILNDSKSKLERLNQIKREIKKSDFTLPDDLKTAYSNYMAKPENLQLQKQIKLVEKKSIKLLIYIH